MHIDVVFTLLDHDAATVYPQVVDSIRAWSVRPGEWEGTLDVTR